MIVLVLALLSLALGACDRPPSADSLREWTPSDHHSQDDNVPRAAQQAPAQSAPAAGRAGATGMTGTTGATVPGRDAGTSAASASATAELVDVMWRQQCSTCHGPLGKGDGRMSAMFRVPDLSQSAWQSQVSDADIAAIIRNGKGKMPSFDAPDDVVRGLVARVRSVREN